MIRGRGYWLHISVLHGEDHLPFHLCPKEYGDRLPSRRDFVISTTGLRIPGTAAEASTADQMTQSGEVR